MKLYPQLVRYTMYFDNLTNEIIFMEAWDNNEIIYYDELPNYNFIKIQLGYSLIDCLYLPFDNILGRVNEVINDLYTYDFQSLHFFLSELAEMHPYFGFYLLKFDTFFDPDDFDELDCLKLISNIRNDINLISNCCRDIIEPLLNIYLNGTTTNEKMYYEYIESKQFTRYFRNGEQLDYNLYYKTTLESIISYNQKPLDEYSFYKSCFIEYLKKNKSKLDIEYERKKREFNNEEDILECYGFPYQSVNDMEDAQNGILPKKLFFQGCFQTYIQDNGKILQKKYANFLSTQNFQFVDSVTIDEGIKVSIRNCLYYELTALLKKHCKISICQNCGKLFPIMGDYNTKYCERTTNKLTCKVIANRKITQKKINDIPAMKLYMKYYKRYKGRVRIMKISKSDFDKWNQEAKKLRDKCINNIITFDTFSEWLENYETKIQ